MFGAGLWPRVKVGRKRAMSRHCGMTQTGDPKQQLFGSVGMDRRIRSDFDGNKHFLQFPVLCSELHCKLSAGRSAVENDEMNDKEV